MATWAGPLLRGHVPSGEEYCSKLHSLDKIKGDLGWSRAEQSPQRDPRQAPRRPALRLDVGAPPSSRMGPPRAASALEHSCLAGLVNHPGPGAQPLVAFGVATCQERDPEWSESGPEAAWRVNLTSTWAFPDSSCHGHTWVCFLKGSRTLIS